MPKSKRVRTPNCTHINMDRVYSRDQQCYVCGREPSIGFLYECRQDCDSPTLRALLEQEDEDPMEIVKSEVRLQLEWAGVSESIIRAAEQGHYTPAQLELLKAQKQDLRQIISDTLQATSINNAMSKLVAMEQAPSNNDGTAASKPKDTVTCAFRACHSCRPYYRDRVYISFQSVFDADFPPLTLQDVEILPIKSAHIMKSVGNSVPSLPDSPTADGTPLSIPTTNSLSASTDAPPTASTSTTSSSDRTFKTTQTDLDDISAQHSPRRRFYKMGHRSLGDVRKDLDRQSNRLSGLKTAVQNIFRSGRESSSEGSSITLPLPRTGTVRNSNDSHDIGDFDLPTLRKVRKEKERSDVKHGTLVAGFEDVHAVPTNQHTATPLTPIVCSPGSQSDSPEASNSGSSDFSISTSASAGSEIEVEGGVALTEEAVETHTPDILEVNVPAEKNAVVFQGMEMTYEEDDDEADIGLQSIMAQV
ncbi:hypothetical protein CC86DRAFT_351883 [Ophiobolus disseminans]|uniref:Uncharacterized protein n=1 Tax=Ophiobolus disseminans TaxID=1469910 RepID=A0A6A6ZYT0_9PLEO|nr:hypothetical protein CC86DRAFT_351883 [Ophiobolus disseminans]